MNLLVLMGAYDKSYDQMRDLLEIKRTTILEHSFNTLKSLKNVQYIFALRQEDINKWHVDNIVKLLSPNAKIVIAKRTTEGAACTALLAVDLINNKEPLIITGGNQIVMDDLQSIVDEFVAKDFDAATILFHDIHPRWSYFRIDEDTNLITEAAEKNPISRNASTGFYYYKKGSDFVESAEQMIMNDINVNGNYCLSLCINEMILKQKRIGYHFIDKSKYFNLNHSQGMIDYEKYLESRQFIK